MTSELMGPTIIAALVTIVVLFVIWQLAATYRAKSALAREGEYRKLAETAAEAQVSTEARLAELARLHSESATRLAAIEKAITVID